MKKVFQSVSLAVFACLLLSTTVSAQRRTTGSTGSTYSTALGLGLDFGDGGTYVGPSIKHFFTRNNVGKAEVLFGRNSTQLAAYYQYHGDIQNASGLKWTLGLGGSAYFNRYYGDDFAFRPTAGLDFKVPDVPLGFEFDWRPAIFATHGGGFTGARFGFGFRFCF